MKPHCPMCIGAGVAIRSGPDDGHHKAIGPACEHCLGTGRKDVFDLRQRVADLEAELAVAKAGRKAAMKRAADLAGGGRDSPECPGFEAAEAAQEGEA